MQWHPLLAELLRPVVEAYYEVQTNVPVGDVPREADLVLLRRKAEGSLPFHGIWTLLTTWNILEFKSPSVTPAIRDLDLLLELGLGIDRRLNEERTKRRLRSIHPRHVSFWYLANRLSDHFLENCKGRLGKLRSVASGVWRSRVFERKVFLVSNADLPVDVESLPLHIVSKGQHATEMAMARFVMEQAPLRRIYGQWVLTLHENAWKEVEGMSRAVAEDIEINVRSLVDYVGLDRVIKQVGLKRVIEEVGLKRVVDEVGLKRVIDEIGPDRVLDEIGTEQILEQVGIDRLLASMTPAQRREMKRRLR